MKTAEQSCKETKSNALLTNLLDEQIDRNQELLLQTQTLRQKNRNLVALLQSKDQQLASFKDALSVCADSSQTGEEGCRLKEQNQLLRKLKAQRQIQLSEQIVRLRLQNERLNKQLSESRAGLQLLTSQLSDLREDQDALTPQLAKLRQLQDQLTALKEQVRERSAACEREQSQCGLPQGEPYIEWSRREESRSMNDTMLILNNQLRLINNQNDLLKITLQEKTQLLQGCISQLTISLRKSEAELQTLRQQQFRDQGQLSILRTLLEQSEALREREVQSLRSELIRCLVREKMDRVISEVEKEERERSCLQDMQRLRAIEKEQNQRIQQLCGRNQELGLSQDLAVSKLFDKQQNCQLLQADLERLRQTLFLEQSNLSSLRSQLLDQQKLFEQTSVLHQQKVQSLQLLLGEAQQVRLSLDREKGISKQVKESCTKAEEQLKQQGRRRRQSQRQAVLLKNSSAQLVQNLKLREEELSFKDQQVQNLKRKTLELTREVKRLERLSSQQRESLEQALLQLKQRHSTLQLQNAKLSQKLRRLQQQLVSIKRIGQQSEAAKAVLADLLESQRTAFEKQLAQKQQRARQKQEQFQRVQHQLAESRRLISEESLSSQRQTKLLKEQIYSLSFENQRQGESSVSLQKTVDELRLKNREFFDSISNQKRQAKSLLHQVQSLSRQLASSKDQIARLHREKSELQERLSSTLKSLVQRENQAQEQKQHNKSYIKLVEDKRRFQLEFERIRKKLQQNQASLQQSQGSKHSLKSSLLHIQKEKEHLQKAMGEINIAHLKALKDFTLQLDSRKQQQTRMSNELKVLQGVNSRLLSENSELRGELNNKIQIIQSQENQFSQLNETLEKLSESKNLEFYKLEFASPKKRLLSKSGADKRKDKDKDRRRQDLF